MSTITKTVCLDRWQRMKNGAVAQKDDRTRFISAYLPFLAAAAVIAVSGRQALRGDATAREIFLIVSGSLLIVLFIAARVAFLSRRESNFEREIKELNRRIDGLLTQVDRDALTGLLNHRAIHERLERQLVLSRMRNESVAVIMADLDDFKVINDTLGHQAGDQVLRVISSILTDACRETDAVARYAGDEFMIVLPDLRLDDAAAVGARIAERVREVERMLALGHNIRISLSIGIAVTKSSQHSLAQTVAVADAAMYEAKRTGTNQVVVVDADAISTAELPILPPPSDELIASVPMRTDAWAVASDRRDMYAVERHSSTPRAAQA
jgi:diguanylate cyclase (GGDEF)-like protein